MAIKQLSEEQARSMTVEEKDRWWLENVYQGDVPQMTVRVVISGFLLGGLLSITNLCVGANMPGGKPRLQAIGHVIGAFSGAIFSVAIFYPIFLKGKFPLTPVGIGLAFVISFQICLAMFFGSFMFWVCGKIWPKPEQRVNEVVVQNQESICAGLIAGAALVGVALMALELKLG